MRVPPPKSLKLERAALLADVRERLAERLPEYADGSGDPTDPGWLLLEQAAWMVEMLSEQLDRYPFSVLQQLVHLMGGHIRPAQPAVGVVVVQPQQAGLIRVPSDRPSTWRFYTAQTEERDIIEFLPAEVAAEVLPGRIASMSSLVGGELYRVGGGDPEQAGLEAQIVWRQPRERSRIFEEETARFSLLGASPEALATTLTNAAAALVAQRGVGWLSLEVTRRGADRVVVSARLNPAGAFDASAPGGLAPGGDLTGAWGTLPESNWTPPVQIADHPGLPLRIRGTRPLPGAEEGALLVPAVPAQFPVAELLERRAAPLPEHVVASIWAGLVAMDTRLVPLKPVIERDVSHAEVEPDWVGHALRGGRWDTLATGDRTFIHIALPSDDRARTCRVALVPARGQRVDPADVLALGVEAAGLGRAALEVQAAWILPAPDREGGRGMDRVVAMDVQLAPEHDGVLLVVEGEVDAAFLNALLVINAPLVQDGRELNIDRTVPTALSLFFEDLVTPAVMEQLLEEPIPREAAALLRRLPLARFEVEGQPPVKDFQGVSVDATTGELIVNAPDDTGQPRTFRPGGTLTLSWYRRTDGDLGEVEPGAIEFVGQSNRQQPRLIAVTNPLGTWFGGGREQEQDAIDRLLAPSGDTPVLPSDWERAIRRALGGRGRRWVVRCWSYAERALVSGAVWPMSDDAEATALRESLRLAGPEVLLVVLGPKDELLAPQELAWARQAVDELVARVRRRLPTVRSAIVARFWPLAMRVEEAGEVPPLPTFDVTEMRGQLVDTTGREAAPPTRELLLLNAAVVRVRAEWT